MNSATLRYTDQITMPRKLFSESSGNVIPKNHNTKFLKHPKLSACAFSILN